MDMEFYFCKHLEAVKSSHNFVVEEIQASHKKKSVFAILPICMFTNYSSTEADGLNQSLYLALYVTHG